LNKCRALRQRQGERAGKHSFFEASCFVVRQGTVVLHATLRIFGIDWTGSSERET
jgi:hypothetical protein